MKIIYYSILCLALLLISCAKENEKEEETSLEEINQIAEEKGSAEFNLPELDNDYLVSVYEVQELIKMDQQDIDLRKRYCDTAYLSDYNVLISMGIAKLHNPKDGSAIPQHLAERVARLDAMRWAGYGEKWLKNNYQPDFGKLQTRANYPVQMIDKAIVGDSLFVFLATKIP
jgi:hypothetical protein